MLTMCCGMVMATCGGLSSLLLLFRSSIASDAALNKPFVQQWGGNFTLPRLIVMIAFILL